MQMVRIWLKNLIEENLFSEISNQENNWNEKHQFSPEVRQTQGQNHDALHIDIIHFEEEFK